MVIFLASAFIYTINILQGLWKHCHESTHVVQATSPHTQQVLVGLDRSLKDGVSQLSSDIGRQHTERDDVGALEVDRQAVDLEVVALLHSPRDLQQEQ